MKKGLFVIACVGALALCAGCHWGKKKDKQKTSQSSKKGMCKACGMSKARCTCGMCKACGMSKARCTCGS